MTPSSCSLALATSGRSQILRVSGLLGYVRALCRATLRAYRSTLGLLKVSAPPSHIAARSHAENLETICAQETPQTASSYGAENTDNSRTICTKMQQGERPLLQEAFCLLEESW